MIEWISKGQTTIATCTAQAEYHAVAHGTSLTVYVRQLVGELGFPVTQATTVLNDNKAAVQIANNDLIHSSIKHLDIKYKFVREFIALKQIRVRHVGTHYMIADILTKAVPRTVLVSMLQQIKDMCVPPKDRREGINS